MAVLNKNSADGDIDILLAKYIAGQADAEESSRAERWIAAGETNAKRAEHLRLIWEESGRLAFTGSVDVPRAWQGFRHRILQQPDAATARPLRRRIGWIQAAAIFVVLIGVGTGIYIGQRTRNNSPVLLHPFSGDQVRTYTLPDGSVVRLEPHSSLSYPSQFTTNQRNVGLEGDAFFTVTPDPRKPFRVVVNGITITVLGTSFGITSSSGRTEIVVRTGSIEVAGRHRSLRLYAREKLIAPATDTGWIKGTDSSENTKVDSIAGNKPPVSKLTVQKPDIQPTSDTASLSQVPAAPDPLPHYNRPRSKIDEQENKIREEQMKGIVRDLSDESLIKDYKSLVWFSLTDTALYINGVREPDDIQKRFKEKYNVAADRGFFFGPFVVPKIARGMHADRRWLLQQVEFQ